MISENEVGKMLEKIEADIKEIESKIEENKKMNNKKNNLMIWEKLLEVLSTMRYLVDNQWENNEVRNKIIKLNEKVSELINVATELNKKKK
jgi:Mg2+ and Co2+ transporter CorA